MNPIAKFSDVGIARTVAERNGAISLFFNRNNSFRPLKEFVRGLESGNKIEFAYNGSKAGDFIKELPRGMDGSNTKIRIVESKSGDTVAISVSGKPEGYKNEIEAIQDIPKEALKKDPAVNVKYNASVALYMAIQKLHQKMAGLVS